MMFCTSIFGVLCKDCGQFAYLRKLNGIFARDTCSLVRSTCADANVIE